MPAAVAVFVEGGRLVGGYLLPGGFEIANLLR
jgi:hypothetical protein